MVKHVIFAPKRCCLQFCTAQVHRTSLSGGRGSGFQPVPFGKGAALPTRPPGSHTDADTELVSCQASSTFWGLTASDSPFLLVSASVNAVSYGIISRPGCLLPQSQD